MAPPERVAQGAPQRPARRPERAARGPQAHEHPAAPGGQRPRDLFLAATEGGGAAGLAQFLAHGPGRAPGRIGALVEEGDAPVVPGPRNGIPDFQSHDPKQ